MSETSEFRLNNAVLLADRAGVLYWPDRDCLVVSDLHFEKGSSFARRGSFLPPYDTRATLAALAAAIERYAPRRVISLGDSFHDAEGAGRMNAADRRMLGDMMAGREWIWILGNHDPQPPEDLPGEVAAEINDGPLVFRHEAVPTGGAGEVSGHFHPKAAVVQRGRRVSAKCFVEDGRRLILPSFGAFTGGLDVLDPAIARHFPGGFTAHMLGKRAVYRFTRERLRKVA